MAYTLGGISQSLRLRNARRLLDEVKAGIDTQSDEAVRDALARSRPVIGGPLAARTLGDIITGRMRGQLEHSQASEEFVFLSETLAATRLHPVGWFVLENLSRAIGCFAASTAFGQHGRQRILSRPPRTDRERTAQFLAHLYERDVEGATQVWHTRTPRGDTAQFWADAGQLLWLVTSGAEGERRIAPVSAWRDLLEGRLILALGPAPTTLGPSGLADALVARVVAPGVTSWPDDVVGGRIDLSYANSDSAKWFVRHGERTVFDQVEFASFRTEAWQGLGLSNARTAWHHKRLLPMPFDKTNMVPLIAWDVLHVPGVTLKIAGTTFFASATAYTPHDVRLKHERGGHTDQRGSTGMAFERCLSFSGHHLSAHHTLMGLLAQAGAISFDADGRAVVELSTEDYLTDIDRLYGVDGV